MTTLKIKQGWEAQLSLLFDLSGAKTILRNKQHKGPLLVQRPFYPEGDNTCHVYIIHPPGGVVGGDILNIDIKTGSGTHALITTPAAGKFYRSSGAFARQDQVIKISSNAILEWLPQETIIYNGAKSKISTRVELDEGAHFLGWEITCLGLPTSSQKFTDGVLRQHFEVWQQGKPVLVERGCFEGQSQAVISRWGLANYTVVGTLVCTCDNPAVVENIRLALMEQVKEDLFSVTVINGLVVCRYLGHEAYRARFFFAKTWGMLRNKVFSRPACHPRIWNT